MTKSTNTHGSSNETPVKAGVTHRKVTPDKNGKPMKATPNSSKSTDGQDREILCSSSTPAKPPKLQVYCLKCWLEREPTTRKNKLPERWNARVNAKGSLVSIGLRNHLMYHEEHRRYYWDHEYHLEGFASSLIGHCPVAKRKAEKDPRWQQRVLQAKELLRKENDRFPWSSRYNTWTKAPPARKVMTGKIAPRREI